MEPDTIFIDIRTSKLTLAQALQEIQRIQAENPDYEIFLDGDAHAIAGRKKRRRDVQRPEG
ncbi:MAG: hypothetical protein LBU30_05955 [Candidatus Methanoplasma sp.]|nr:hypothetical protein [Candidatus Methanoplasma sp.]